MSSRGSKRRAPSPALERRTIQRFEEKREMDVNNYTLEMRLKFCKDLRILAEQIEETKQRILDKVEQDVAERTAVTQSENDDLTDKIDGVQADKDAIKANVAELQDRLRQLKAEVLSRGLPSLCFSSLVWCWSVRVFVLVWSQRNSRARREGQ